MANFTTSTPTTSDPSEIHGLLAVGTDNTGKLLDPDALAETATNLAYTASPTQGTITSDTGTDATIPAADGTNAGLFLPAEKTKLAGIAEGAEVNVQSDWNAVSGDAQILNKPTLGTAAATNSTDYATAAQGAKADTAVQPAALANYQPLATVLTNTTAAFTTAQETKLAGIAAGAEVNVNPDWNAVSGDAQILNKPTLGTAAATNSTDYATAAQGAKADTAVQPNLLSNLIISTTPPTTRDGGAALVDGDRWFKPTDNGVAGTAGMWIYKIVQADPLVAYWVSTTQESFQYIGTGQTSSTPSFGVITHIGAAYPFVLESLTIYVETTGLLLPNDIILSFRFDRFHAGVSNKNDVLVPLLSKLQNISTAEILNGLFNNYRVIDLDYVFPNYWNRNLRMSRTLVGSAPSAMCIILTAITSNIHP